MNSRKLTQGTNERVLIGTVKMAANCHLIFIAAIIFLSAQPATSALPQIQEQGAEDPVNSAAQSRYDQLWWTECKEGNNGGECVDPNQMIHAFEGWNKAYHGFERSPILFDPREKTVRERQYPSLIYEKGIGEILDVSADDVILKTSMAIYQPLNKMHADFAANEFERDKYLNMFNTIRGVAELTLSYLDKTVAAGLATVQQHVDMDATQQILKQISWTSSQLANPHRNQLYNDIDEKVEACMAERMETGRFESFTEKSCEEQCASEEEGKAQQTSNNKQGNYSYCLCCAQVSLSVNYSVTKVDNQSPADPKAGANAPWSLAERVLWGTEDVRHARGANPKAEFMVEYLKMFRGIYGDIVFKKCDGNEDGSNAGLNSCEELKFEYVYPGFSVPEIIEQLRLGPLEQQNQECPADDAPLQTRMTYCPITQEKILFGICPALKFLIDSDLWPLSNYSGPEFYTGKKRQQEGEQKPLTQAEQEQLLQVWVEASLGDMLDARDIINIQEIGKTSPGAMIRWIDAFCDASSVAAFVRLHTRMVSIALDHMAANQRATDEDKKRIRELMGRVTEYLRLANVDVNAGDKARLQLIAASVKRDRETISKQESAATAMVNAQRMQQKLQDFVFFGAAPGYVLEDIGGFNEFTPPGANENP